MFCIILIICINYFEFRIFNNLDCCLLGIKLTIFLIVIIIIIEHFFTKISFINRDKNIFTTDRNNNDLKAKRKCLLKIENQLYDNLNIDKLLLENILFLKNKDCVLCDCGIVNRELLIYEIILTGSVKVNLFPKPLFEILSLLLLFSKKSILFTL